LALISARSCLCAFRRRRGPSSRAAAAAARARKALRDLQDLAAAVPELKGNRASRGRILDLQVRREIMGLRAFKAWQDLEPRASREAVGFREIRETKVSLEVRETRGTRGMPALRAIREIKEPREPRASRDSKAHRMLVPISSQPLAWSVSFLAMERI